MNKWLLIVICGLFTAIAIFTLLPQKKTKQAITYFPIDAKSSFDTAQTHVELSGESEGKHYEITWTSSSKSNKPVYLRQDAALLFKNGQLHGVRSKWKENSDTIAFKQNFTAKGNAYYQAISYHYGEIHYQENTIKSMQQMSHDELFVVSSPSGPLDTFQMKQNDAKNKWEEMLTLTTMQRLHYQWEQLLHHFDIQKQDYLMIPLTSLYLYNKQPFPNKTQEETNQIIGRLWEGLYKNYIIGLTTNQKESVSSYTPIILFSNDQSHLLVLYEINGKKEKLIQQL